MKSAGLPCRFADCRVLFGVVDPSSMGALIAACDRRDRHEIAAHGYHHQRLEDHVRYPFGYVAPKRPRPLS